ncbi:N-acetylneuraminic acid mutarotase, partial [Escherichia coli]|nr:N-acetylneuraminic acid mutarotase [Escherichia coli]
AGLDKRDKNRLFYGGAKPGVRTDSGFELFFTGNNLKWNKLAPVSSPHGVAGGVLGGNKNFLFFFGGGGVKRVY